MERLPVTGSPRNPAAVRVGLVAALAVLALGPLLLLTIVSLGRGWFWPDLLPPDFDAAGWRALLQGPAGSRLLRAAGNSVALGLATGVLAAALGLPIGRAIASLRGWRRSLGAAAAFLPVAAPPIAVGVGLQYSFLSLGLGGSLPGVLLAHMVPALGYASLYFLGIFLVYDDRMEAEARSLGAAPRQVFTRVTLPRLARPIVEAALLGFLVSWAQVPLTLLIGQGVVSTLAVEVLAYVRAGQDALAATGALLLVAPALFALLLAGLAIRRVEAIAA